MRSSFSVFPLRCCLSLSCFIQRTYVLVADFVCCRGLFPFTLLSQPFDVRIPERSSTFLSRMARTKAQTVSGSRARKSVQVPYREPRRREDTEERERSERETDVEMSEDRSRRTSTSAAQSSAHSDNEEPETERENVRRSERDRDEEESNANSEDEGTSEHTSKSSNRYTLANKNQRSRRGNQDEDEQEAESARPSRSQTAPAARQPVARKHLRQQQTPTGEKEGRPQPGQSYAKKQTARKSTKPHRQSSGDRRSRQMEDTTEKKKKKKRPKLLVLRDIRRLQATTNLLIPRLSFSRLVREVARKYGPADVRFQAVALDAIQEAAEFFLISLFEDINLAAIHGRRVTVMPRDVSLVLKVRGDPKYASLEQRGKRRA